MTTFTASTPAKVSRDPAKHVNYSYGMVLGVDDFTQEFAYLAARDQSLARDLSGYGTVCGLRVRYEPTYEGTDRGPRLAVSPGTAVCPSGQIVRVCPAQCAYLVEWMTAHRAAVLTAMGVPAGGTPPASGSFAAYIVLCYADCLTDEVPIPGEPCRSEDDLMAPSRVRDDFRLELRLTAPDQREEEAVRRFVSWVRQIEIVDGRPNTVDALLDAARTASGIRTAPGVEPCPPVDQFFPQPPSALGLPRAQLREYLRALWRLWVTELLPCWRGAGCGCGGKAVAEFPDPGCVLLAGLTVNVTYDVLTDRLLVDTTKGVAINEDRRPYLVNTRLLQEWALSGEAAGGPVTELARPDPDSSAEDEAADAVSAVPAPPVIVAGGRFAADGSAHFSYGGLRAVPREGNAEIFDLIFDEFDPGADYVITGSVLVEPGVPAHVLEVVGSEPGQVVRIRRTSGRNAGPAGFELQVTRFGGGGG